MATFDGSRKELQSILEDCRKTNNVNNFKNAATSFKSVIDRRALVDQVFHDALLDLQQSPTKDTETYTSFITFCIEICKKNLTTENTPVILLSDIFETSTIPLCETYFSFVEDNLSVWKDPQFYDSCKNSLLRMCNGLLSRLSKEKNAIFGGRILIFLAKLLPFYERSGLNLTSTFNVQNFDDFERKKAARTLKGVRENEDDENMVSIYVFFRSYLMIKRFFRSPNLCYNKNEWDKFEKCISIILDHFDKNKLTEQKECEDSYDVNYLKEIEISAKQLQCSKFRRQILVQFLIVFQYLNGAVKFKTENQKLEEIQVFWIESLSEEVYNLLAETFPKGEEFADTVRNMMKREELWINWKNNGCPALKRPLEDTEIRKPKKAKKNLGDILKNAEAAGRCYMAKPELTALWNLPNNTEACRSKERDFLPSIEEYFKEAAEQLNPDEMVEEMYKKINDEKFSWTALRLLRRRSLFFFNQDNQPKKLSTYLEKMIKKIY